MAERVRPEAEPKRLHERARRTVFGYLGPAILHETNNVLTVMAGVRQIMKSGAAVSDRIGTMIDEQLTRMEHLVASIRRIGPDEVLAGAPQRTLSTVADALEEIVKLAGKGRGVAVERGEFVDAVPADAEALALASLCLVLPLFPPRGVSGGSRLTVGGRTTDEGVALTLAYAPLRETPAPEDDAVARALASAVGGSCDVRRDAANYAATLVVPAARPEAHA